VVGRAGRFLAAAGAAAVGGVLCLARMVGGDGSRLPGDLIDCRFVGYVLEHGYQWLTGRVPSFWDAPFFHPMTRTLALSDTMAGALPLYAGLRVLVPGPEQAMVGLVVLFFLLNFAATVLFLRLAGAGFGPALVAAYPVAFGLLVAAFGGQPQCLQLYPVALCLLALVRFLAGPSPGKTAWLAVALTGLGLTYFYYFAFTLVLTGLAGLVALAVGLVRPADLRRALGPNLPAWTAVAGCLLVLGLYYWPYYQASRETGPWPVAFHLDLAPSLAMFLAPARGSLAWGWLESLAGAVPQDRLFPGFFPVLGAGWGLWLVWRRPDRVRTAAGVLVVAALASCAVFLDVWGAGNPVRRLPGISSLRVLLRVGLVALPCFALGLGLFLTRLTRDLAPRWRALVLVLAFAAVAADQDVSPQGYRSFAWKESLARVDALMARIPGEARVFYLDTAAAGGDTGERLAGIIDAMLAAQRLGKATYNGYSGWAPPTLAAFFHEPTCHNLEVWRDVAAALYHPGEDPLALYAGTVLLGLPPCPPDPAILAWPQGRHQGPLPRDDRRVRVEATAVYAGRSRTLTVTATLRNLGSRSLHGLGDYFHRHAVFLVAELTDAAGARHNAALGRLVRSIAPGETLTQQGSGHLPPGFVPRLARVSLFQPPAGEFALESAAVVPVTVEP
jgi:hypothetical protein